MNINQMLQQTGAVEAISRELGIDPATAKEAPPPCCRHSLGVSRIR